MRKPFFQRLQVAPIHVAFEDIIPAASTAARVRQRAVYKELIHQWPYFLTAAVRDRVAGTRVGERKRLSDGEQRR